VKRSTGSKRGQQARKKYGVKEQSFKAQENMRSGGKKEKRPKDKRGLRGKICGLQTKRRGKPKK
jgi:hypothetical protein